MASSLHLDSVVRFFAFRFHLVFFVAAALFFGAQHARADTASCTTPRPIEISQAFDRWAAELFIGNLDRVSDFYTDNATLVANSTTEYRGKQAIRIYYSTLLSRHPKPIVVSRKIIPGCNSAVITGFILYRVTGDRKGTRDLLGGRYETQFAFKDGGWRIVKHTFGGDQRKLDQPIESSML